jgi:uncharacterized protein YPO0396
MTARLNSLQQQLQGFDQLKDSIARNEIELGWNKQHLAEIEDRKKVLNRNTRHMSEELAAARKPRTQRKHSSKRDSC